MDAKKLNYLLIAATIVLGGIFLSSGLIANAILTSKSAELSKLKAQSEVALDLQDAIKKNKADIVKYSELNEIAKAVVPQDKNQAQTVSEIVNIAAESGIGKLSSITFPASTLGGAGSKGLTQVTPVKGIAGVYLLPITITQNSGDAVPYSQFVTFLQKLENNRRTAQVSTINLTPDSKNPNYISFTLTVNEYIKP
ncbi:hypothetical protein KDA14_00015 [Candidatus Saccharibacteria bacterium]|nr:hypothetical protein [Candidatus Saccharibacteria bacterium]